MHKKKMKLKIFNTYNINLSAFPFLFYFDLENSASNGPFQLLCFLTVLTIESFEEI